MKKEDIKKQREVQSAQNKTHDHGQNWLNHFDGMIAAKALKQILQYRQMDTETKEWNEYVKSKW
jgi:hypothetical protein